MSCVLPSLTLANVLRATQHLLHLMEGVALHLRGSLQLGQLLVAHIGLLPRRTHQIVELPLLQVLQSEVRWTSSAVLTHCVRS